MFVGPCGSQNFVGHYPLLPRFWVGPVNVPLMGPILQAPPPPGTVSNHVTDGGFKPESSTPVALQHAAEQLALIMRTLPLVVAGH